MTGAKPGTLNRSHAARCETRSRLTLVSTSTQICHSRTGAMAQHHAVRTTIQRAPGRPQSERRKYTLKVTCAFQTACSRASQAGSELEDAYAYLGQCVNIVSVQEARISGDQVVNILAWQDLIQAQQAVRDGGGVRHEVSQLLRILKRDTRCCTCCHVNFL